VKPMNKTNSTIQQKLMRIVLLTSGLVVFLTCTAFVTYQYFTFKQSAKSQLSTLGEIVAANSTAALAFEDSTAAIETLNALKAEKHIIASCLYDTSGSVFATYPDTVSSSSLPVHPGREGYYYADGHLHGFQQVVQGDIKMGTLYLKSDLTYIYQIFVRYSIIGLVIFVFAILVAYIVSKRLQKRVSEPILALSKTAATVSHMQDYSIRAKKYDNDELGLLTDAFNNMLDQISSQNEEITSFAQALELKVNQRTEELAHSNRDLEQFAYVASHDLQEPLRKIQIFSSQLATSLHDKEASAVYIAKIISSAARMSGLIKGVLNYSRLTKDKTEFAKVNLEEIIHTILTDYELVISEKEAQLTIDKLPEVPGNKLQLNQLFSNLLSNSLKFSNRKPLITISCSITQGKNIEAFKGLIENASYAFIIFKDNGIGFSQEHANNIFNVFQRLHKKQDYPGTGIGLALCKKIVENHKGNISATSVLGEGTSFSIHLPMNSTG
jgi:signal transduction histidine kinase